MEEDDGQKCAAIKNYLYGEFPNSVIDSGQEDIDKQFIIKVENEDERELVVTLQFIRYNTLDMIISQLKTLEIPERLREAAGNHRGVRVKTYRSEDFRRS